MLNEISRALLNSDVNVRLVVKLSQNIRKVVDFEEMVRDIGEVEGVKEEKEGRGV